jgi:hypothetical protein
MQVTDTSEELTNNMLEVKKTHLNVAMYAWDGMAHPGNEVYIGRLSISGDPAAACCSSIAELGNHAVNQYACNNLEIIETGKIETKRKRKTQR